MFIKVGLLPSHGEWETGALSLYVGANKQYVPVAALGFLGSHFKKDRVVLKMQPELLETMLVLKSLQA